MREPSDCANEPTERGHSVGVVGKYVCSRCGWRWTPRPNSPDPPRACARCRSAYWHSAPLSSRANFPSDAKWQAESQSVARRRRERRLAKLRELAAEFGVTLPPIRGDVSPVPFFPLPNDVSWRGAIPTDSRDRFKESHLAPAPAVPQAPRMSLSERLARAREADAKRASET
jgi:hypothetical protein